MPTISEDVFNKNTTRLVQSLGVDNQALASLLHDGNKVSRKIVEDLTGLKWGKDINQTKIRKGQGSLLNTILEKRGVTRSQLTDIWKKANTPEDALIQEARKYKSAELDRWRGDSFWGKTVTEKASEINVPLSEIGEGKTISLRQSQVTEKGVREWMDKIQSGERPAILVGNRPMGKGEITVLDGNHTLEAYRRLGFKEIPVIDIKSQLTDIWKKANQAR